MISKDNKIKQLLELESEEMSYIVTNKEAWEDAFEHRNEQYGLDNDKILRSESLPFLENEVKDELRKIDWSGKKIAQFCCNDGRELLSIMQLGASQGVGFDIAENIIAKARETAKKIDQINCEFVACNILDIDEKYRNQFDFIYFTIGAITWFEDLKLLFQKVAECLKPDGVFMINDFHPFENMLPLPGEDTFDIEQLNKIAYSYFRKEPWIENNGLAYMTPVYESKTFTSFTHTLADIINSTIQAGMNITSFQEFDYDIGLSELYNGKGYPLSYLLMAQKNK